MINFTLGIIVTTIVFLVLSIFVPTLLFSDWFKNHLHFFQAFTALAILLSVLVTYRQFRQNAQRNKNTENYNRSKSYLNEAKVQLERAFLIFTSHASANIQPPPRRDRLRWLETARALLRSQEIKTLIVACGVSEHITLLEQTEEYWRHRFFDLIDSSHNQFSHEYFGPNEPDAATRSQRECIARDSIAVIFDFSNMTDDFLMDNIDSVELFANDIVRINQRGLREYLASYQTYWRKIEQRMSQIQSDNSSGNNIHIPGAENAGGMLMKIRNVYLLLFNKARFCKLEADDYQEQRHRRPTRPQQTDEEIALERVSKKRKNLTYSFVFVVFLVSAGVICAHGINTYLALSWNEVKFARVVSVVFIAWSIFGKLDDTASAGGETFLELTSDFLYRLCYSLGIFIATCSLFLQGA